MRPEVIAAAEKAFMENFRASGMSRGCFRAAIRAADLARADDIRAAVERIEVASEDFAQHYVSGPDGRLSDDWRKEYKRRSDKQDEARRALLSLLGIVEGDSE
jgi:hypothetical protein